MQIGEKLKQKRNEAGISQEVLAEKIGVSRQTVSNWENNRSYPDIGSVLRLSDLYGISLDELLKEDTNMRKHVEETAKLPVRWWKILYGLTIALIPLSTLLDHWGIASAAAALKYISLFLLPVLAFTRWKLNGGKKTEIVIMLGLWVYFLLSELLGGFVSTTWLGASVEVFLLMAFLLIYGYGAILGKGLIFWLLIFLYFGTPVCIAVEAIMPTLESLEPVKQVDLYGTYVVEDVLYGDEATGYQISVVRDDAKLYINGESVGCLHYTKPLENQQDMYAVWQLVPENAPDTLYRLEVDTKMNKTISCTVDEQLRWKWSLSPLPEVRCLIIPWDTSRDHIVNWFSEADQAKTDWSPLPLYLNESRTLALQWDDETVTTLTVEETIGDGVPKLRTLYRDEDGNFPLGEIFPESGVIHTYRIEYLGGAFVLQVKSLP